jgi:DNA-binding GntR family transcriptional regulator
MNSSALRLLTNIDQNSRLPLYVQIANALRATIKKLKPGQKFFTEEELVKRYRVSKMTVRQAVQLLADEGLLRRNRGVGTFVSVPVIEQKLDQVRDFLNQWFFQDRSVSIKIHCFETRACPPEIAGILGLRSFDPVLYVGRLRYAEDVPLVADERYFPLEVGRRIGRADVERNTIYRVVTTKLKIPLDGEQMQIWADRAGAEEARLLQINLDDPVLIRTNTFYTPARQPIWTGKSFFRSDMYRYTIYVPVKKS